MLSSELKGVKAAGPIPMAEMIDCALWLTYL